MRGTPEERFWPKVDTSGGPDACWLWAGAKHEFGYGLLGKGGRATGLYRAHVFSWELHNKASVVPGNYVCHSCNVPACVNPKHLRVDSPAGNTDDALRAVRHRNAKPSRGILNRHSKLTTAEVAALRRVWREFGAEGQQGRRPAGSRLTLALLGAAYGIAYSTARRTITRGLHYDIK